MAADNILSILIISQDREASSHTASILRSELGCLIDECLNADFIDLILENCPQYDVLISIQKSEVKTLKSKKADLKIYVLDIENKSLMNQKIEALLHKIKSEKNHRPFFPLDMKYIAKFSSLPLTIWSLSTNNEMKIFIKENEVFNSEKLKQTENIFFASNERYKLRSKLLLNPETLLFGCLEQSDTSIELFTNYEKITKKKYPHLNPALVTQYSPYLIQAFKICELNPRILSKIESHFDQNPYYIYHSFFLALTSLRILSLLNLSNSITASFMAFTALVHDLEISIDNKFKSERDIIQELEAGVFDKDSKTSSMLLYHGENMARLIEDKGHFPRWVIHALGKHHERPRGSGFPAGEDTQNYPIESLIFIIAHSIADQLDLIKSDHFTFSDLLKKISLNDFKSPTIRNNLNLFEKLDIMIK